VAQKNMIALAQQGDPAGIAFLINHALQPQGIQATVTRKQNCLYVLLEAPQTPSQEACVQFLHQGFSRLQLTTIDAVKVYGRQQNQKQPVWHSILRLNGASFSSSIQSSPAKKSSSKPKQLRFQKLVLGATIVSFSVGTGWGFINYFDQNQSVVFFSTLAQGVASVELPTFSLQKTLPLMPAYAWKKESVVGTFTKASQKIIPPIPEISLTIKAVGDIVPGTNYPANKLHPQGSSLFQSVKPYLQNADIVFGNFESTLTNYPYSAKDISRGMTFAFRTPPIYSQFLKAAGFDVLNLANNHSMDFFEAGFEETFKSIEKSGMKAFGKKNQILYQTIQNVPVAWIGFSTYDYHNSALDIKAGQALVAQAKQKASLVIISVHAGAEGSDSVNVRNQTETFFGENRGNLVQFSHAMIDAGADLILGHGPHVPRALELYKNKLIAYSLGNFVGYRTLSTVGTLGYSLILQVQVNSQGDFEAGKIIPVQLDSQGIPYIDQNFRSVQLIRNLTQADFPNTPLKIEKDGSITKKP
jgi:poly-gamma-glutamate capsule biosynthesis protein CapA/YwtB (metallophosphatase superfamily)